MIIVKTISALHTVLNTEKKIGFVPTMGALHNGHLSLIEASKKETEITVSSLFVNPTQFNDINDYNKYPVTIENDIRLLEKHQTGILFLPAVTEIYPDGMQQKLHYELGYLENILEGKYRPGHYQGVCQIVHRLLQIVKPQILFLGRKDYQQCMVLQKMITQLHIPVSINIIKTVRETNGLAMSSRNLRLTKEQQHQATAIYQTLCFIKENKSMLPVDELVKIAADKLLQSGFESVDYAAIADAATLQPLQKIEVSTKAIALIAATLNGVRLIDNLKL